MIGYKFAPFYDVISPRILVHSGKRL